MEAIKVKVSAIQTAEPFRDLFPVHEGILQDIVSSMQQNRYDPAQPIILWEEKNVVLDGHTRLAAAKTAGIEAVPVIRRSFKTEEAALDYAIHLQVDRRNLEDKDIMRLILILDKRGSHGGDRKSAEFKTANAGLKAEATAKRIGTSRDKIERARYILDHADDKLKKTVLSGAVSIRKAYERIQRKKAETLKCKFTNSHGTATVSRLALLKVLKAVSRGLATDAEAKKSTPLAGIANFCFEPQWVRAYHDSVSISYPLRTGLANLEGGISSKELLAALGSMTGNDVHLTVKDKGLIVSSGNTTFTFPLLDSKVSDYVANNLELEQVVWKPLPKNFMDAVDVCIFNAISNYGVFIDGKDMITADQYRATMFTMDKEMMKETVLPLDTVRDILELNRLGEKFKDYARTDHWFHLKTATEAVISVRPLVGLFPPVREEFSKESGPVYSFPEGMSAALTRAAVFAVENEADTLRRVIICREDGFLICKATANSPDGRLIGEVVDRIKLDGDANFPEHLTLHIPPLFLQEILDYTNEFRVTGNRIFFNVGNFRHVIAAPGKEESAKENPVKLRKPA